MVGLLKRRPQKVATGALCAPVGIMPTEQGGPPPTERVGERAETAGTGGGQPSRTSAGYKQRQKYTLIGINSTKRVTPESQQGTENQKPSYN